MKWTEELKNEVVDLFKLGHSFRGIANMLTERGIPMTRNSIAGVLKRADVLGFLRPRIIKAEPEPKPESKTYPSMSLLLNFFLSIEQNRLGGGHTSPEMHI